jgi:flagellar biosynthesis protein FliQ
MTTSGALDLLTMMLLTAAKVTAPVLLIALFVGVVVGVLQAATQINEASISFVTKLLAISVAFVVFGPWMIQQLADYTTRSITGIADVVKQ